MNVAILLSGYIRSFKNTYKSIKENLIDENKECNFDVYLHYSVEKKNSKYLNEIITIEEINKLLKFKSIISQDDIFFSKNIKLNDIYNQNYKMYILNQHKNNVSEAENKVYDYTIRLRPDVYLESKINLKNLENGLIYLPISSKIDISKLISENDPYICDILAYGSDDIMNRYFDLFKYLKDLTDHYGLVNETLLWYYLENNNIKYNKIDIKYTVILSQCNTIAITGDSGTGKTTLSNIFQNIYNNSVLLECDRYHKWERGNNQWNKYTHLNPEANYITKMTQDVFNLKLGNNIYQVDYNHKTGKFTDKECIESKENIIICGLHSSYLTKSLINLSIFLDTQEDLRIFWKIKRDMKKRGYTKEKVYKQILDRRNDFEKYILPQREKSDIIINYYSNYKFDINTFNEKEEIKLFLRIGISNEKINNKLLNKICYEKIEESNRYLYFYFNNLDIQSIIITIINNL
jgi:uridine kinase